MCVIFLKEENMKSWILGLKKAGKLLALVGLAIFMVLPLLASAPAIANWQMSGQSLLNLRFQPLEFTISQNNAAKLKVSFKVPNNGGGDVSATPSVSDGNLYFPDWAGNLYSVNAVSGAVNWQVQLSNVTGIPNTVARSTPTVSGNSLIVGTLNQGWLLSFNRLTGQLQWKSQLDSHPFAVLTQSPVIYNSVIYIGVASSEEGVAADPSYPCCTFRGSFLAVDLNTGSILWKTYTVPDNGGVTGGYSGNAVWGSTASIDPVRNLVYIGTGNNYTVPAGVASGTTSIDPTDYTDAILALNLTTGQVVWADPLLGLTSDAWNVACFATSQPGLTNCPNPAGPDFDFGQGPMHIITVVNGKLKDLIVDGQKSGKFWALDADTGAVVWMTDTGFGSTLGGMEWGSASDLQRIYVANAAGGFWAALDPATGAYVWKTFDPNPPSPGFFVKDIGALSVANGVVYAGSLGGGPGVGATNPTMFALNAKTGQILWSFASGGSVASGPAIANGVVYWGTGYSRFGIGAGAGSSILYAFKVK